MSSVVISGDTSGAITVSAPAVAGTNTLTLQAATATNSVNTLSTAVASTSGTSIDFTGLPSWIKRITVMFNAVSTNGTSNLQIQIGSSTFSTSGYISGVTNAAGSTAFTAGLGVSNSTSAAETFYGMVILSLISNNTWQSIGNIIRSSNSQTMSGAGGSPALSGALDRVRITTVTGTDTFDAGTINILYEG